MNPLGHGHLLLERPLGPHGSAATAVVDFIAPPPPH
jgi:hypothetical protein